MYFSFDAADATVNSGFGHIEPHRNFHAGVALYPQIEHRLLLLGKVAHIAKIRALQLSKFAFDVQGASPLLNPSPLGLALLPSVYCNLRH